MVVLVRSCARLREVCRNKWSEVRRRNQWTVLTELAFHLRKTRFTLETAAP